MKRSQRRAITLLIRLAASVLFILLLSQWLDLTELKTAAGKIRPGFFLLSLGLVLMNEVIIALRLRVMMESMKLKLTVGRVVKIGLMSRFYAVFLPSGIGFLLARWYKVTENRVERLDFAAVTLTEKVLFVTVTLISVAIPLSLFPDPEIQSIYTPLMLTISALLLAILGILSFCTSSFGTNRLVQWVEMKFQKLTGREGAPISALQTALERVFSSRLRVLKAVSLSVLVQIGIILRIGFQPAFLMNLLLRRRIHPL
jgi:uncharacterized membrane protein YbhN (UPF0104 family)